MAVMLLGGRDPGLAPNAVSGLTAWWAADANMVFETAGETDPCEDGEGVYTWKDQASSPHNLVQTTAGQRAIWHSSGGSGNQPYLEFTNAGSREYVYSGLPELILAAAGSTVFTVIKTSSGTNTHSPFLFYDNGIASVYYTSGDNTSSGRVISACYDSGSLKSVAKVATISNWHIAITMHDSTNLYAGYTDPSTSAMASTPCGAMIALDLGAANTFYTRAAGGYHDCYISEMSCYNVALSEANRQAVCRWLANKYALTITW